MKSVAAALLDLLHLPRPRLLIIRAVVLPGEITFTCKKIGAARSVDYFSIRLFVMSSGVETSLAVNYQPDA